MLTLRTRRNVSLVLFIGLLLVSVAAWSMIPEAGGMKDGTYVGTAKGFGGDLVVDVTISDGKINEVSVRPHQETPFIADAALEQLTATVVQAQSANIDAVSGATMTSNALIEAVGKALNKATGNYEDGVYAGMAKGFGGDLIVDVTISDGKISEVAVRPHQETPFVADAAIEELTAKIVEAQTADLDVVSGATVTSTALMEAVADALTGIGVVVVEVPEEPSVSADAFVINVGDGTHRGTAKGFGGELVLDVTVSGGKITEIVVVENSETPFIAGNALKDLPLAIVEAQGPVDTVSGATVTSKALMEAVENALLGGTEAETYAISVGDGTHRGTAKGFGGELVLDVTVSGGKITEIVVVENSETPFIAGNALKDLPLAIVEAQGPVDTVSGATVTSKALLEAVEKALLGDVAVAAEPAETYEITVGDGTHRGTAQGFGGELVLDVTVSGGKITEIVVVEDSETPFIAAGAFKELLPAIIEAQGPVDTVSGATATSQAVLKAVEDALTN